MKNIIKYLRKTYLINAPVRFLARKYINFNQRVFTFFSIHWPVSGIIHFKLPQKETVKMFSNADDYITTQAYWKGYMGYEGPSVQLFYYLSRQSSTIIDIGANVGYFTLIGGVASPRATVYSFEPVKKIYDRLNKNISLNSLSNIITENVVVGNSEEPVKFYVPNPSGISLAGSTRKGWADNAVEITVPSVSLDAYKKMKSILAIRLIKIDAEFHETEILEGMKDILRNDKPLILMEVLFPEGEGEKGHFALKTYSYIEHIMKQNNYYFYLINDSALIRMDKLEYNPEERNYLFSAKRTEKVYNSFSDMNNLVRAIM